MPRLVVVVPVSVSGSSAVSFAEEEHVNIKEFQFASAATVPQLVISKYGRNSLYPEVSSLPALLVNFLIGECETRSKPSEFLFCPVPVLWFVCWFN